MKLHLGCGDRRLPDFINVDIRPTDAVDVLGDISKDLPYEKESIDLIYSCANIEHFGRKEWIEVVKYWFTLLKPKGVLRLSTADLPHHGDKSPHLKDDNIMPLQEGH